MKYDVDEEIQAEKQTGPRDGCSYQHPSYGMIQVNRYQGGNEEPMFGASVASSGGMRIMISSAEVCQDLGRNWYHSLNEICEVRMSPVQFAELITNPNTEGMPCTVEYVRDVGHIRYRPIDTVTEYIESKIEKEVSELKRKTVDLTDKVTNILGQKGPLKRDEKAEIATLVQQLSRLITSDLPFYEEQLSKSIDRQKMEARAEIEAHIAQAIHKVGLDTLNNPNMVRLLLEEKSGEQE